MSLPRRDLAPISANESYPLEVFKARTGLSDDAMRQLRRKGFPVCTVGKRRYVLGSDWLRWLNEEGID